LSPFKSPFVVLAGAFLLLFANMGLSLSGMPLFYIPVPADLGFSQSAFSVYQTIASIVGMVLTPFAGVFIQKFWRKNQLLMLVGTALNFLCFLLYSLSTELWHFYALSVVRGAAAIFIGGIAIAMMINHWFIEKRAMALSVAYVGTSLGGIFYTKFLAWIITDFSWRAGYLWAGIVCGVLSLIAIFFCLPEPGMVGAKPFGHRETAEGRAEEREAVWGMTYKHTLKTPIFWLFCFSILMAGCVAMTTQQFALSSLQVDAGMTAEEASNVFSVYLLILCFAKLLLGWIYDRFGNRAGTVYIGFFMTITTVMLASISKYPQLAYPFAVVFGLSNMIGTIATPTLTSGIFGSLEYGSIYAMVTFWSSIGSSLGPVFIAACYDGTGSYAIGWWVFAAFTVISTLILVFCAGWRKKLEKRYPEG